MVQESHRGGAPLGLARPTDALLPLTDTSVPIACTLSGPERGERITRWHHLLAGVRHETVTGGLRWRLPGDLAAPVAELAAAEQRCCPFFDFTLRLARGEVWLEARAPAEASALFADVFGTAPEQG